VKHTIHSLLYKAHVTRG